MDTSLGHLSTLQVYFDSAAEWARQHDLLFAESSSLTSYNVKHIFEHLLQEIYNRQSRNRALENGGHSAGISLGAKGNWSNGGGGQCCS